MHRIVMSALLAVVLAGLIALVPADLNAQGTAASANANANPPDFTGVYYPFQQQQGRGAAGGAGAAPAAGQRGAAAPATGQRAAPPPPTRSAPTGDLSQGRAANAPPLTPEYMAKWEIIRKSRMSGSYEYDNIANCLPPGMPHMMNMSYGMEIMQSKDKITFFSEWQDALRRIYLDGRKPSQKVLNDPTYAGYSTGHWEGDTLVVDTVALSTNSYIDGSSPHSEEMTVKERIRFVSPGILEDRITVTDPKALTKPWETVRTYRKADRPNDELREFACAEGLRDSPK
jgi:hypothetical protein